MKPSYTIIHLGGSVVVPHISDDGGINTAFLKKFLKFMRKQIKKSRRFIIVVGGGKICRSYQKSAEKVGKISDWDLDWIGIHATRLNAHLLRTMFVHEAYQVVIDHDPLEEEVEMMKHSNRKLFFASGWRPGWSTDYIAVRLAQKFGAKEVLIAKDTPFVYDADPKKSNDAKAFKRISWRAYKKLIPPTWKPGLSAPVDPIATRLAAKSRMSAKIFKAADFKSFQNALEGQSFEGTIIS